MKSRVLPLTTGAVCRQLGINAPALHQSIRNGRATPPAKDNSGRYLWYADDIERLRAELTIDRRKQPYRTKRSSHVHR